MRISARIFYFPLLCTLLTAAAIASAADSQFHPEKFYSGHTRSTGVFRNTIGKPEQHFTTDCRGRMRGQTLYLDQLFRYDDGHTQARHWQIRQIDGTHYVGHANDVVGDARGEVTGSSFHFVYTVALSPTNPILNMRLDQTMTLRNDGTLENHATIRKLGLPLSRITEQFRRVE